jgi:hypothetical protein
MKWIVALLWVSTVSAQTPPKHLNPVIEKLAAGKPFVGVQTGDLSLENARSLARVDIDYVYLKWNMARWISRACTGSPSA